MTTSSATHPYESLGEEAFWSTAVARRNMFDIAGLWNPKFRIHEATRVATYGSCFAQHIGRALQRRRFTWLVTETAPARLSEENARRFNYGVFSARTGNIYTASLLRQWVGWASGNANVPDETWEAGGRFYDPFRPNIEPDGFASLQELQESRQAAIAAFRRSILESDVFVFTLGLTESWFNRQHGYEYPMCPGTVAGTFDAEQHEFRNQDVAFIGRSLLAAMQAMRAMNPKLKVLLTVSPVPLTATMSGQHVLVATMESKSVLRAVAAALRTRGFVDYFPSYEIINAAPFRGTFFEANQRHVNARGVEHVMATFFDCLAAKFPARTDAGGTSPPARAKRTARRMAGDAVERADAACEEELLGAFAGTAR